MNKPSIDELRQVLAYNAETGKFSRLKKWGSRGIGSEPGSLSKYGYWQIGVFGRTYTAQVLAWALHYGEWPADVIDHINRDKCDNRIVNLRSVSRTYNSHNTGIRANNTSGVTGVTKKNSRSNKKPWEAFIGFKGKRYELGRFASMQEAVDARKSAEKSLGLC